MEEFPEDLVFPSRLLNEGQDFFGLDLTDLVGAMSIMILLTPVLERFKTQVLAVPIVFLVLMVLVPIRLKYRRHIIRDTCTFYLTPRRLYDPRFLSRDQSRHKA